MGSNPPDFLLVIKNKIHQSKATISNNVNDFFDLSLLQTPMFIPKYLTHYLIVLQNPVHPVDSISFT